MSDPFAVFPKDESGRLHGGIVKRVPYHELAAEMAKGWQPMPTNDGQACHHDHYGVFCRWAGKRPWWRRVWAWLRIQLKQRNQ
jgi:hypothetical protein